MPRYVCDDCEKAFQSKDALREHREQHAGGSETALLDRVPSREAVQQALHPRNIRRKLTVRNLMIMFGVVMMATLFAGTAFYMSTTAPAPSSPTGQAAREETNPPSGFSVNPRSLPSADDSELPDGYVSDTQLSQDAQLYLLTQGGKRGGPAVLMQYNCDDPCPETVNNLTQIAQDYQGWVYVAPYDDMDEKIALTAYQRLEYADRVDRERFETFICSSRGIQQSVACAVGQ